MVDSGACDTVLRNQAFQRTPLEPAPHQRPLRDISGGCVKIHGKKVPQVSLPSGRKAKLEGTVTDSILNALSVRQSTRQGLSIVFGPSGAYMTAWEPQRPADAEDFEERGDRYYLRVRELSAAERGGHGLHRAGVWRHRCRRRGSAGGARRTTGTLRRGPRAVPGRTRTG